MVCGRESESEIVEFRGVVRGEVSGTSLEERPDAQFKIVFDAIRQLMALPRAQSSGPPAKPRRSIGFRVEEGRPAHGSGRRRNSLLHDRPSVLSPRRKLSQNLIPDCQIRNQESAI